MSKAQLPQRRTLLIALAAAGLVPLSGCMTKPLRPVNADGTYCYRIGKSYRPKLTCTPTPVPAAQVESQARDCGGSADRLTVYLVRKRWGNTEHVISVSTPGTAPAQTVPESFARLRDRKSVV